MWRTGVLWCGRGHCTKAKGCCSAPIAQISWSLGTKQDATNGLARRVRMSFPFTSRYDKVLTWMCNNNAERFDTKAHFTNTIHSEGRRSTSGCFQRSGSYANCPRCVSYLAFVIRHLLIFCVQLTAKNAGTVLRTTCNCRLDLQMNP